MQPEPLLALTDEQMRAVGLSRAKVASLRDLAAKVLDGTVVLSPRGLARESDDEIIARLSAVRGIGPWTAEMFLIFQLRRLDVWPVGDLGVRRGYGLAWQIPEPTARELAAARRAVPALPVGGGLVLLAGRGTVRGRGGERADPVREVCSRSPGRGGQGGAVGVVAWRESGLASLWHRPYQIIRRGCPSHAAGATWLGHPRRIRGPERGA